MWKLWAQQLILMVRFDHQNLPLLVASPAALCVSVRATLASRSGRRVVGSWVFFCPRYMRNYPAPICFISQSPMSVAPHNHCVAASPFYVIQGPLLCCVIGANLANGWVPPVPAHGGQWTYRHLYRHGLESVILYLAWVTVSHSPLYNAP